MQPRWQTPLKPQTGILRVLGALVALTGVSAVVNLALPIFGLGHAVVSVDVPGVSGVDAPQDWWTAHAGVAVDTVGYRLSVVHPDIGQRVWAALGELPAFVLFAGVLVLAHRLIRGAERDGLFTSATAGRLRTLGLFLLVGALVKTAVEMAATGLLLATMITRHANWVYPSNWQIPWTVLMSGVAVLTAARIMRIGAEMHDELQGIV